MNDKVNYLVLVNADHRLPDHFEEHIEIIEVDHCNGNKLQIEKKTYDAFMRLREELMKSEGIHTELSSVYRTVQQQEAIFDKYRMQHGIEYANRYVSKPGHSEHHTGFAIDVGIMLDGKFYHSIEDIFKVEHLYQVIHGKLSQFGFILRYPEGKKHITKIGYEPWHFRYVDSSEIADEIMANHLTLEEYLALE